MFFTPSWHEWHFFYFDQRDLAENDNHWQEGGPHIHLVNWLWPNLDGDLVWSDFVRNKEVPRQALHLRYVSDDRTGVSQSLDEFHNQLSAGE